MMEVKKWANILGWVLLVLGVLGFIPGITSGGHLLGIFAVDGLHNTIHLVSGAVFIWAARKDEGTVKMWAKVFGIIYGIIAVLGLFGEGYVLGFIVNNMADAALHIVIAAIALYIGFGGKKMGSMTGQPM